jgi:protein SCO1
MQIFGRGATSIARVTLSLLAAAPDALAGLTCWLMLLFLLTGPASAGLTEADIGAIGFTAAAGANVPLELTFRDAEEQQETLQEALAGKPALLLPVDYECRVTCGPALAIVAGALAQTGLRPGADFRLILVGLNPSDRAENARAFAQARIGDAELEAATAALTGDAETLGALMSAIGYRYAYDLGNDAFAHPTGVVALTADGRIARALSSFALDSTDLRLALIEAGEGRIGGLFGRIGLLCYGFDPVHGIYTASIMRLLQLAGAATVLLLAGALGLLFWLKLPQDGTA